MKTIKRLSAPLKCASGANLSIFDVMDNFRLPLTVPRT